MGLDRAPMLSSEDRVIELASMFRLLCWTGQTTRLSVPVSDLFAAARL